MKVLDFRIQLGSPFRRPKQVPFWTYSFITHDTRVIRFSSLHQDKRLGALNKFKAKDFNILICTDVASRGLDIQGVDVVINYDIPMNSKVLTLLVPVPVADQHILLLLLTRSCIFFALMFNLYIAPNAGLCTPGW
jgi:hypothetical protein